MQKCPPPFHSASISNSTPLHSPYRDSTPGPPHLIVLGFCKVSSHQFPRSCIDDVTVDGYGFSDVYWVENERNGSVQSIFTCNAVNCTDRSRTRNILRRTASSINDAIVGLSLTIDSKLGKFFLNQLYYCIYWRCCGKSMLQP
jgi:hypothetical protein